MKKIGFKYFFLLFISVLSCFGVYTKSIQNTGKIFSHYVVHHAEVNAGKKQHFTQSSLAYEVELENVEISESEIDETDLFDFDKRVKLSLSTIKEFNEYFKR